MAKTMRWVHENKVFWILCLWQVTKAVTLQNGMDSWTGRGGLFKGITMSGWTREGIMEHVLSIVLMWQALFFDSTECLWSWRAVRVWTLARRGCVCVLLRSDVQEFRAAFLFYLNMNKTSLEMCSHVAFYPPLGPLSTEGALRG